jgi:hypothetical protein
MRQKPFILILLAVLHWLAPFGNLFINSYRQNISPTYLWSLWLQNSPGYHIFIFVVIPILSGSFIYICRRWSFFAYLVCMAITVITSAMGFRQYSNLLSVLMFVGAILFDVVLVVYFMIPAVKRVYMDPKLRWWETLPRYQYNAQAKILEIGQGQISNISMGGLLLFSEIDLPEQKKIQLEFGESPHYLVSGRVVYHKQMKEHGYGIQFDEKHLKAKTLKSLIQILEKEHKRIIDQTHVAINFKQWLKLLFKSGKGILPEFEKK